jgi:hypothetical protein
MPYSKRYVDGVLLNWGDRLFYEPLHRLKAPSTSRVVWSGNAAQLRAQIARTVRRVPEVMVKITNRPGGRKGMKAISGHLRYISRNGKVELEDQDDQVIVGTDEIKDLADEWRRGGFGIPDESRHREAFNIMLSMPPGTDRLAVRHAARDFAKAEFAENHRYIFAAHNDEAHPHIHLVVQARGYDGRRLNPRKADLQRWREGFAQRLREYGIDANATPRRTRGVTRQYAKQAVVHLRERRELAAVMPMPRQDSVTYAMNPDRRTLDAWHQVSRVLAGSEHGDDRRMSVEVTDFVRRMRVLVEVPTLAAEASPPVTGQHKPVPSKRRRDSSAKLSNAKKHDVER